MTEFYAGLQQLSPFLAVIITLIAGVFAYRASEKQKLKDGADPKIVRNVVGGMLQDESAIRDLTAALTLNTNLLTKLISHVEDLLEQKKRDADLRHIINALQDEERRGRTKREDV